MTSSSENVNEFDLHIHVGTRPDPHDTEVYCSVTYPGVDPEHPIEVNYTDGYPDLSDAIAQAALDISKYMADPEEWAENYIKEQGHDWQQLRMFERRIEASRRTIESNQRSIEWNTKRLAEDEQEVHALRQRLENKKDI